MGNFNRDRWNGNRDSGGNRDWNRGGGFGRGSDRGNGRTQMHRATCANCGKSCDVPFKPSGDKPVFCRECFNQQGDRSDRGERNDRFDRDGGFERKMFAVVCDNCGKKCEVPFRPTGDKEVFCNDCFNKGDKSEGRDRQKNKFREENKPVAINKEMQQQLTNINDKLDRLLRALEIRGKLEEIVETSEVTIENEKPVAKIVKPTKKSTKAKTTKKAVAKTKAKSKK